MSATENALEVSHPSTEFEHQALTISAPNVYKEAVSPQSSLSDFSRNTTPFAEVKNSLHGSDASVNNEMEIHVASSGAPSIVVYDSKTPQKHINSAGDHQIPRKGNTIF